MFEHIFDAAENVTFLPVPNVVLDDHKRVVYSVPINAAAGDRMIFSFSGEATNGYGFNVMLGRAAILAATSTAVLGQIVTPLAVENITPAEHHKIFAGAGVHVFSMPFVGFLNVFAYAGSSAAPADAGIPVEQGYGRLDVAMFRAAQTPPTQTPPSGSVTLTSEQASMIKAALLDGHAEREAAAALL